MKCDPSSQVKSQTDLHLLEQSWEQNNDKSHKKFSPLKWTSDCSPDHWFQACFLNAKETGQVGSIFSHQRQVRQREDVDINENYLSCVLCFFFPFTRNANRMRKFRWHLTNHDQAENSLVYRKVDPHIIWLVSCRIEFVTHLQQMAMNNPSCF